MTANEPRVHTLEDVAEGVLNGIFCTYEPPDPRRMGQQPSILRRKVKNHRGGTRHIRWKDEKPLTPKIMNWNDTMQRACIDASLELGCKPMMDTPTALAKARSKSPTTQTNLVFDDEGFPAYRDERLAKKPPPSLPEVPPPSRKEPFLPQLCGIPLGCGDDPSLQDTSLVDEFRYEQALDFESDRKERLVEGKVVPIVEEYVSSSDEEAGDDWASGSVNSHSSLLYRIFAYRKKKDASKMATLKEDDSDDSGIAKSRRKKGRMKIKKLAKRRSNRSSDWDESVPVVPLEMRSAGKSESRRRRHIGPKRRSRSVSPRRRSRSASPAQPSPARRPSFVRRRSKSPVPRPSGESSSQQQDAAFYHQQHLPLDQSDRQSHIGAFREELKYGVPAWNDTAPNQHQQNGYSHSLLPNKYGRHRSQSDSVRHGYVESPNHIEGRIRSPSPQQGYPDVSVPRYFDPTNPRAFSTTTPGPIQKSAQYYQQSHAIPQEINPPAALATNNESDSELTWEERTRLAWNQIRSGVAALTLEAKQKAEKTVTSNPHPDQQYPERPPAPMMQSPSYPRDQQEYHTRKVTFGEPQKLVYYDGADENHSERSFSTKGSNRSRKTKLRLRGTKLIGGALGRVKKTFTRRRSSSEARESHISSDEESLSQVHTWGSDPIEIDRRREQYFDHSAMHQGEIGYDYSPKRSERRHSNPLSEKN